MGGMADSPQSQVDAEADSPADQTPETPDALAGIPIQSQTQTQTQSQNQTRSHRHPGLTLDQFAFPAGGPGLRARCSSALAEARHAVVEHAGDLIAGGVTALVIAGGGWLVAAALTLAVWVMAAPTDGSYAAPLHVAGQLWLAAHHVLLQTPDGPFGLSPLGFTALPAASLVLAGRYVAHRFGAGVWSLGALAVCYPLASLVIAWSAASGVLHAELSAAAGYPCLIACCGYGAGLLSVRAPSLDRWAVTAVRAGTGALAVLLGGAALLAALAVCLRFTDVVRLGASIGQGVAGDSGLFLIDLALVPNLVVWALGFSAGPGFAVGQSTSVSIGGSVHGTLPGLPLVQAVPHTGALSQWAYLVFGIPLAAGVVAVLITGWSLRSLADRAAALGAAVPAVGAVVGVGAVLSGGPVAAGALSAVGPVPWQVALAVLLELAFVAVFGFGLWYAIDYGRGYLRGGAQADPPPARQLPSYPQLLTEPPPPADPLPGLDDDGLGDLVAPGLVAGVPERPEQVEDAGQDAGDPEDPVEEEPQETEPGADRLAVGEAGEPDAGHPLAVGLPGTPGLDGVVDGPDDADQADDAEDDVDRVAAGGAGDPAADDGEPVVEGERGDPVPPAS